MIKDTIGGSTLPPPVPAGFLSSRERLLQMAYSPPSATATMKPEINATVILYEISQYTLGKSQKKKNSARNGAGGRTVPGDHPVVLEACHAATPTPAILNNALIRAITARLSLT